MSSIKKFEFSIEHKAQIDGYTISGAVGLFEQRYPHIGKNDIKQIRMNGQPIAWTGSRTTGNRIYYRPGCPFGYTDCIHDPMREAAANCNYQGDMDKNAYRQCSRGDWPDTRCDMYHAERED